MNEAEKIAGLRIGMTEEQMVNWNPEGNFSDAMTLANKLGMTFRQTKSFIMLKIPGQVCEGACSGGTIANLMKNIVSLAATQVPEMSVAA